MTLFDLLVLLLIAGLCGAIGQAIAGYSRGGCLASVALGFIGAIVGLLVARSLGLHELFALHVGGNTFPVVWSILGSALFVAFVRLLTHRP